MKQLSFRMTSLTSIANIAGYGSVANSASILIIFRTTSIASIIIIASIDNNTGNSIIASIASMGDIFPAVCQWQVSSLVSQSISREEGGSLTFLPPGAPPGPG